MMMKDNVTIKKIYTSRYANPELKTGDYYTVGISLGHPRWKLGYTVNTKVKELAPDKSMWNVSEEEFNKLYTAKLDEWGKEGISSVIDYLMRESDKKDIVLLCFEDIRLEGQYCHRTVLGKWITENLGIEVSELKDPSKPKGKVKGDVQATLLT